MDYIFASVMKHLMAQGLSAVVSYDIVCQWAINLWSRIQNERFPSHLQITIPTGQLRYAIPKYHFRGHKEDGHNKYSLNLMKVGRTDGEEVERNWSRNDETAASTREMGPGSREDTIEDHLDEANHDKEVTLGELLSSWLSYPSLI
jgi:hypothetical protein